MSDDLPDRLRAIHEGTDRMATLQTIADQHDELAGQPDATVTCPCGASGPLREAYRCQRCNIYFCRSCAETHFQGDAAARLEQADRLIEQAVDDLRRVAHKHNDSLLDKCADSIEDAWRGAGGGGDE